MRSWILAVISLLSIASSGLAADEKEQRPMLYLVAWSANNGAAAMRDPDEAYLRELCRYIGSNEELASRYSRVILAQGVNDSLGVSLSGLHAAQVVSNNQKSPDQLAEFRRLVFNDLKKGVEKTTCYSSARHQSSGRAVAIVTNWLELTSTVSAIQFVSLSSETSETTSSGIVHVDPLDTPRTLRAIARGALRRAGEFFAQIEVKLPQGSTFEGESTPLKVKILDSVFASRAEVQLGPISKWSLTASGKTVKVVNKNGQVPHIRISEAGTYKLSVPVRAVLGDKVLEEEVHEVWIEVLPRPILLRQARAGQPVRCADLALGPFGLGTHVGCSRDAIVKALKADYSILPSEKVPKIVEIFRDEFGGRLMAPQLRDSKARKASVSFEAKQALIRVVGNADFRALLETSSVRASRLPNVLLAVFFGVPFSDPIHQYCTTIEGKVRAEPILDRNMRLAGEGVAMACAAAVGAALREARLQKKDDFSISGSLVSVPRYASPAVTIFSSKMEPLSEEQLQLGTAVLLPARSHLRFNLSGAEGPTHGTIEMSVMRSPLKHVVLWTGYEFPIDEQMYPRWEAGFSVPMLFELLSPTYSYRGNEHSRAWSHLIGASTVPACGLHAIAPRAAFWFLFCRRVPLTSHWGVQKESGEPLKPFWGASIGSPRLLAYALSARWDYFSQVHRVSLAFNASF